MGKCGFDAYISNTTVLTSSRHDNKIGVTRAGRSTELLGHLVTIASGLPCI